ncbi:MAG: hypothetical protein HN742_22815 [Lentisphaerae bacterium]|nr:hypothetical protein [Lentisphaerota bacterium]MBT4815079.1 hypothetical protein [Lentisphaerota bacterium]MBT5612392.1 hypothetical protein [Lentisphaerota bacterium]MBT7060418.1 hypothetical protein [Lentisphaerota bacterium]MBT7844728.1 hypothetical protein [Lentisphaerota bacterium]
MTPNAAGPETTVQAYPTVEALKSRTAWQDGVLASTTGFHEAGDGGGALYRVQKESPELGPNGADVIALGNGRVAVLLEREAVNYRMFGAVGDGGSDDGVQIKRAHHYASSHRLPVVNLSGEFWIKETNNIPITTNVSWGNTTFHIDERFNDRRQPRFSINNDEPTKDLTTDAELKAALLKRIRPGVQIIPELAEYAGHLVTVSDSSDRIGIRAGYANNKGWAREDFFYVEEEGRIIGDIAWEFKDLTSIKATPCNDTYLIVEGGGFYFSGDTPVTGGKGYYQHGIKIRRSRTIVRQQWMGLEKGRRDVSIEPRCGFYVLQGVYDVTLENIRCMPWEQNRGDKAKSVAHGTYGLGGARMLNCTFRNLTAEAGWVSWGVFGTNLNKNFRIEGCRLNRIDVHFHCWNLYISDCIVGFKGISVTGGGDLFVDNTTRHGTRFITFRPDYGAKWDGRVRLRGCTLVPTGNGGASVLSYGMRDIDYKYPIGYARSIQIEDMTVDYRAAPDSTASCWLMTTVPFSKTSDGGPLFFPQRIEFRDIRVEGREQGVRLLRIPNPYHYSLVRPGGCDDASFDANCALVCDNVQLEALTPERPDDTGSVHLLIGGKDVVDYGEGAGLFPTVRFTDCENVSAYFGNCAVRAFFERCTVNTLSTPALRGELVFNDCRFRPNVKGVSDVLYNVDSTLGTRFTNCTVHAPVVNGQAAPGMVDRIGFLTLNGAVRHFHLNTALGNRILEQCKEEGVTLTSEFLGKLRLHHALDH